MTQGWQYQVEQFGSAFKPAKPAEVELLLNEAALEGWELSHTVSMSSGNKLLVILRRPISERERKRSPGWP